MNDCVIESPMGRWQELQAGLEASGSIADRHGLAQARDGTIVCDLSPLALLSFEGDDAETFLHAQLSSDVRGLSIGQCQIATYNSPKGRVLATLLLWRTATGFAAQLPGALAQSIQRRLSMFVLRSKVRIADASARFVRLGIGGPQALRVLTAAGLRLPVNVFDLISGQRLSSEPASIDYTMRLSGNRYELVVGDEQAAISVWHALHAHGATPGSSTAWRWLTVMSGVADVHPQTQDQFVPQMLNYDVIGAVSFTKGCYPGQEIVARTQYRGAIKRRTLLAHIPGEGEFAPGAPVFSDAGGEQAIGALVDVAPSPDGGSDALMCVHVELARGNLHVETPRGVRLDLRSMPYPIAEPA